MKKAHFVSRLLLALAVSAAFAMAGCDSSDGGGDDDQSWD